MVNEVITELRQIPLNADGKPYMCDIEKITKKIINKGALSELIQKLLSK